MKDVANSLHPDRDHPGGDMCRGGMIQIRLWLTRRHGQGVEYGRGIEMKRKLLSLSVLLTMALVGCQSDGKRTPLPTDQSTNSTASPATQTTAPTATPWLNDQGYPLRQDEQGHLMVRIPAGTFQMGLTVDQAEDYCNLYAAIAALPVENPDCDAGRLFFADQYPAFVVELTTDFWMDVYETSNVQYKACVDAGICSEPDVKIGLDTLKAFWEEGDTAYSDRAVSELNFEQAQTFCEQWHGGRLATQAEWEYAARGTDGRFWPWGTLDSLEQAEELVASWETSASSLMPVDSYPRGQSPFGLYNMSGNAAEWVSDWFDLSRESSDPPPCLTDLVFETGTLRVLKGGSIGDHLFAVATFNIGTVDPGSSIAGIRCVKDIQE